MDEVRQKFKEIVDRATFIKISKCLECGEIITSNYAGDGHREHNERTGHHKYVAMGIAIQYASDEDARWIKQYCEANRKAFEKLKQTPEWKEFEEKVNKILGRRKDEDKEEEESS